MSAHVFYERSYELYKRDRKYMRRLIRQMHIVCSAPVYECTGRLTGLSGGDAQKVQGISVRAYQGQGFVESPDRIGVKCTEVDNGWASMRIAEQEGVCRAMMLHVMCPEGRINEIAEVLAAAKSLARKYRELTGKPLGITGEVAEFSAAHILGLELAEARQSGYDAVRNENGNVTKIQIKGRCVPANASPSQRLGSIRLDKEWDAVLLVLMDEDLEVLSIHEAGRPEIEQALCAPGSRARNERGALAVSKFKAIWHEVWKQKRT